MYITETYSGTNPPYLIFLVWPRYTTDVNPVAKEATLVDSVIYTDRGRCTYSFNDSGTSVFTKTQKKSTACETF